MNKLSYIFNSGKNPKWLYFLRSYLIYLSPKSLARRRLKSILAKAQKRSDWNYICERADYYNKLSVPVSLPEDAMTIEEHTLKNHKSSSVYFFDSYEFLRYFPTHYKWLSAFGDVTWIPKYPSLVKSRPIDNDNANSVILKLDKVRHFIFVDDKKPFVEKEDKAIFRGKVSRKAIREDFMTQFFEHPRIDAGAIEKNPPKPEWKVEKMIIRQHLNFRYVLALEGIDVASNLKWVMSSNSIAVMPRPNYETWFMEGKLIPNYHYIEVKEDFSDLEAKLDYYSSHIVEAEAIIAHAHEWVEQFMDKEREEVIALLVLQKYFKICGY